MENNNTHCLNCNQTLIDDFCHHCGQGNINVNLTFSELLNDFFGDMFTYDSRFYRTISPLLFKPGLLTLEFFRGRRIPYVPPMRLYLFTTFLLFLWLALFGSVDFNTDSPEGFNNAVSEDLETPLVRETPTWMLGFQERIDNNLQIISQNPNAFGDLLTSRIPHLMFLLLPVFALIIWLHFAFSGFNYLQHFVFTLHTHAFTYLLFLLLSVSNKLYTWDYSIPAFLLTIGYIALALRRAYNSSNLGCILKAISIFSLYFLVLIFASTAFFVMNLINF